MIISSDFWLLLMILTTFYSFFMISGVILFHLNYFWWYSMTVYYFLLLFGWLWLLLIISDDILIHFQLISIIIDDFRLIITEWIEFACQQLPVLALSVMSSRPVYPQLLVQQRRCLRFYLLRRSSKSNRRTCKTHWRPGSTTSPRSCASKPKPMPTPPGNYLIHNIHQLDHLKSIDEL